MSSNAKDQKAIRLKVKNIQEARQRTENDRLKAELILRYAKRRLPGTAKEVFRPLSEGSQDEQKIFQKQLEAAELKRRVQSGSKSWFGSRFRSRS